MDVLSEILDKVELTSSYWYRTSFAGDWGISLPQEENLARFHIVTHGEFWYEVPKLKHGNYTRSVLDKSGAHCYSRRNDCKDK